MGHLNALSKFENDRSSAFAGTTGRVKGKHATGRSQPIRAPVRAQAVHDAARRLRLSDLRADAVAGLTVAIVALPLAMALAIASGTTPEKGLHTAIIAGFLISALGGSRVQIGGPTAAFIPVVFVVIQQFGFGGLILCTLLAGLMLIAAGLLRLGTLMKYMPQPVITGFTAGIAVSIFSSQVKDLLGLQMDNVPAEFFARWAAYAQTHRDHATGGGRARRARPGRDHRRCGAGNRTGPAS